MEFTPLEIPDVVLITPKVFSDERGFFMETFRQNEFEQYCGPYSFVQENHSRSKKGVLRGLHYQVKHPQGKLVRVTRGEVFDVAVDIRRDSPTLGKWVGVYLNEDSKQMMWVPPGFAHGFYVTSDEAELQYRCTDYYAPEHECCIRWDDPGIGVEWPLINSDAQLSKKDRDGYLLQITK
ncbi:dTDP-4-dehydrorhamnose 3,5-epimerase [Marinobacterium rhizophilum]|uniref:dTDP-4-dehydrorhamnose 3,5-epimerase n=1 Tax=Marinobacterium rhizophilum TaxID=420402 RepID=A0ABY5HG77_9GAMM|nr:dTDP-4-dehydrorhamnose 3,5-epimerase [Marinobacterium rhizophilum]UTW09996.1 dTDP-4-dehydrorhamnose 3,5-epimerase [Marinobacterium rhizophilum]